MKKTFTKKLLIAPTLVILLACMFFLGAATAQILNVSLTNTPELTINDDDSQNLPESFLMKDDDDLNEAILIGSELNNPEVGHEIIINDQPYKITEVQQSLRLESEEI